MSEKDQNAIETKNRDSQSRVSQNRLNVDVVSDIVCPWCYVGKRQLDIAIEGSDNIEFDIRWRPFQLNPQMPKEGMSREEYMAKKFGAGGPTENFYEKLETVGASLDINFQFDSIEFAPNTLDSHRLIHWASGGEIQNSNSQTDLVTKLFEVYFEQGGDLGNHKVLVEAAESLGMNGGLVAELLAGDRDVDAVQQQVGIANKMGISGVPCFIIENKYAVMGAQPPQALVEAFKKAHLEKSQNAESLSASG